MPQATVKAYDSVTRTGRLVSDDGKVEYVVDAEAMDSGILAGYAFVRFRPHPGHLVD